MVKPLLPGVAVAAAVMLAPQAHADHADWDRPIEPGLGPSAMASINYALQASPGPYPTHAPGWQVYATPPGAKVIPGPAHFCDTVPYQGAPDACPAGWDRWYR